MNFREITYGDIPDLFIVRTATDENNLTMEELHEMGITEETVREKLSTSYKGWLCEVDGHTAGFCIGDSKTGEIWVIALLPGYINRGIGSRLLALVEEWLWKSGCRELWLTTDIDVKLRAYSFYRKNGWEDDKITDGLRYMRKRRIIHQRSFACVTDFDRVHQFLCRTYGCKGVYNWDIARWSFNRYCVHGKEELSSIRNWEASVRLWEDNKGEIVAVAHIEEPGDYFFQVHPDYKYLEEEMLLWAIDNCRRYYPYLERIVVTSSWNDNERKELYTKYNAMAYDFVDEHRSIELKRTFSVPELPDGYEIIHLEEGSPEECRKVSELYSRVWPESRYMQNSGTVAAMTGSIAYSRDLSFIMADDKMRYVAFAIAWVDSLNKTAHFYPIAMDPEYCDTNLLDALLRNALNKLMALGYKKATISAWYREEENQLFEKLGFVKTHFDEIYEIKLTV